MPLGEFPEGGTESGYGGSDRPNYFSPGFGSGGFNAPGSNFYAPPRRYDLGGFGGAGMNRGGLSYELGYEPRGGGSGGQGPSLPGSGPGPGPGPSPQAFQRGNFGRPAIGYPTTQPQGAMWGRRREDMYGASPMGGGGFSPYASGQQAQGYDQWGSNPRMAQPTDSRGGEVVYPGGQTASEMFQDAGIPPTPTQPNTPGGPMWIPGEGDFRLMNYDTLQGFRNAGYFDPRGNRMLIEAGRMNAARTAAAMQRQTGLASRMYGLDPAQAASMNAESQLRSQGSQSDAINAALMEAYYRQADLANQMMGQTAGSGARRDRYRQPSAMDYVSQIIGSGAGASASYYGSGGGGSGGGG